MDNKKNSNEQEQLTDVKGTIVGFVAPDPEEKTQEQEIQDFQLKKQNEKELAKLSEEEQKEKRKDYEDEKEKVEKAKVELLKSIRERIPAIEKKFKFIQVPIKKGKVVEKLQSKSNQNFKEKEEELQKNQNKDEKER